MVRNRQEFGETLESLPMGVGGTLVSHPFLRDPDG